MLSLMLNCKTFIIKPKTPTEDAKEELIKKERKNFNKIEVNISRLKLVNLQFIFHCSNSY